VPESEISYHKPPACKYITGRMPVVLTLNKFFVLNPVGVKGFAKMRDSAKYHFCEGWNPVSIIPVLA